MKNVIRVKREHIQSGNPKSRCECAIGLALSDCGFDHLDIGLNIMRIGGAIFKTPKALMEFQKLGLEGKRHLQRSTRFKVSDLKLLGMQ